MINDSKYIQWIGWLRIIAMYGILIIHVAAPLIYKFGDITFIDWHIANIYDSYVRNCVPLFFMISGFLLLNKTESLASFYKKRILKVGIPLIVWSIIYLIWTQLIINSSTLPVTLFISILISPDSYHLWFLYALIGVYLVVPVLRIFIINADITMKWYFIIIWFIAVTIIPYFEKATGFKSHIDLLAISGFIGYLVLGHVLGKINISKKIFRISLLFSVVLPSITAFGTFILSRRHGNSDLFLYDNFSIDTVLYSATSFIVFKLIFQKIKSENSILDNKIISKVSQTSLGIYLIHPIVLYYMENGIWGFVLNGQSGSPIIFIPLTALFGFIISCILIYFLQKIPLIKYMVP